MLTAEEESKLDTALSNQNDKVICRPSKRTKRIPQRFLGNESDSTDEEIFSHTEHTVPCPIPPVPPEALSIDVRKLANTSEGVHILPSTSFGSSSTGGSVSSDADYTAIRKNFSSRDTMLNHVFTTLEKIVREQKSQRLMLQEIMSRISPECKESCTLPDDILFPLSTMEDVDYIEGKLSDTQIQKKVINHLRSVGGQDVKDITRRIMAHTISHSLSLQFTLCGIERYGKRKRGFKHLKLFDIVCRSVRCSVNGKGATTADVEVHVQHWLRTASDRNGGKNRRRKPKEITNS